MTRVLALGLALLALGQQAACAHSASDAYMTLTAPPAAPVVQGQLDVALRDLDFVLGLDDDGDGNITWGELKRHQDAIARYVLAALRFDANGGRCGIRLTRQMVDQHPDGAYAALFFDLDCPAPSRLVLDYRLFFEIDPSHRAILVSHARAGTATALLSPENPRIELDLR